MHKHYCGKRRGGPGRPLRPRRISSGWAPPSRNTPPAAGRSPRFSAGSRARCPPATSPGRSNQVMELSPGPTCAMAGHGSPPTPPPRCTSGVHQRITTAFRFPGGPGLLHPHPHLQPLLRDGPRGRGLPHPGGPADLPVPPGAGGEAEAAHRRPDAPSSSASASRPDDRHVQPQPLLPGHGERPLCPGLRPGGGCFDINGLKGVNDRAGHLAGDEFIREAARHIIAAFPGLGYRLGGDEFLVLWRGWRRTCSASG